MILTRPHRAGPALAALALSLSFGPRLAAQTDTSPLAQFFQDWSARVSAAQASQPDWMTPVATTTPRLEEEFRYDQYRESLRNGSTEDVYAAAGKGLELIPFAPIEVSLALPAYQVRSGPASASGLADWPGISVKYRLVSANKEHGDYIVTVFAAYGWPTGSLVWTTHNQVFTPTLAAGKGWGNFDIQATVGDAIPVHDNSRAGRALQTNVTFQYHAGELFWPEIEINRTDWSEGARDGRTQTYLTPGIILGRIRLSPHLKFSVGFGYQEPISKDYAAAPATPTYGHSWLLSSRLSF